MNASLLIGIVVLSTQLVGCGQETATKPAHYDGFVIEAKRPIKAGDEIPVLAVAASGGALSVLSVEATEGVTEPSKAEPWFTAFPEATTTNDRAVIIEAWRIEKGYVASPLGGTSLAGVISVKADPSAVNKAFACSFLQEEGETFAAFTSESGARTSATMPVADGTNEVEYPFMATLKCSDGNFRTIFPALLRAKADIRNNAGVLTISPPIAMPNATLITNRDLIPEAAQSSLWCIKYDATTTMYLRFYPGGTVIAVTAGGSGTPGESWFNETYKRSGKYSISGSSVKFSIGPDDYDGVIQSSSLQLNVHRPMNHRPGRQERFEPCH
jgi:hypothetical protein